MTGRLKQQLGGVLIAVMGAVITFFIWYKALHGGVEVFTIGFASPAFVVIGIALVLFPGYKDERLARGETISGLSGWQLLTPRWRWVFGAALVLAIANYAIFELATTEVSR